jgi:hypothetical protein
MKIPRTLKIGAKKMKVVVTKSDNILDALQIGSWDGNRYIIELDNFSDAPIERLEECFLHEIIEAINGLYEMKLAHWKINAMGEILYQVIKDNKLDFTSR